jgi:hypothetical protein
LKEISVAAGTSAALLAGVVIVAVRCAFDDFELEPVHAALKPNAAMSTAAAMPRDTARRRM